MVELQPEFVRLGVERTIQLELEAPLLVEALHGLDVEHRALGRVLFAIVGINQSAAGLQTLFFVLILSFVVGGSNLFQFGKSPVERL